MTTEGTTTAGAERWPGALVKPEGRPPVRTGGRRHRVVLATGAAVLLGGVLPLATAQPVWAGSRAPLRGATTCPVAGDECAVALAYADARDGGGATVLAVEADTEAHGGTRARAVFDFRVRANDGTFNVHVYRSDRAPYRDRVWWQAHAEGGAPASPAPASPAPASPALAEPAPVPAAVPGAPALTEGRAVDDAVRFVTGLGYQVPAVKWAELSSTGRKDYYTVKLELAGPGEGSTVKVWVDATSTAGTIAAARGDGLDYRDPNIVTPAAARAAAVAATGGGTAYKVRLHGEKWLWYRVSVRAGATAYEVAVDAFTAVVTQVRRA